MGCFSLNSDGIENADRMTEKVTGYKTNGLRLNVKRSQILKEF